MKYRICGKKATLLELKGKKEDLKPFFEVHVLLDGTTIKLSPTLDDI